MAKRFHIVLNANAGTALAKGVTAETLDEKFEAAGLETTVDADSDKPFEERLARALASDAEVIVAAGGDGTVTALAQAIVGTDKSLAILPLGTVNALAKDLHMPLDIDEAVGTLANLEPRRIDVGEVNGKIYLHKVVIGLIPGVAAAREHIRSHQTFGAKLALLRHFVQRLARARRIAVAIEPSNGEARVERVQALAVASNAYEEGFGMLFSRRRLDRGSLTLYVVKHFNLGDVLRLSTKMVLGHWHEDEALQIESVKSVTIRSHKPKLQVMFDGEVMMLDTPLNFRIRPLALSVMAPAVEEEAVDPGELGLTVPPLRATGT